MLLANHSSFSSGTVSMFQRSFLFVSRTSLATFHEGKHNISHMSMDIARGLMVTCGTDRVVKVSWPVSISFEIEPSSSCEWVSGHSGNHCHLPLLSRINCLPAHSPSDWADVCDFLRPEGESLWVLFGHDGEDQVPLGPVGSELAASFPLPPGFRLCPSLSTAFPVFLANVPLHPLLLVRNHHVFN